MPIRLSGMMSGLDTDAIIKEMMSVQTQKKVNIENQKTKLDWKKEKWEEMNTKIYALYTEKLSKLKLQGGYLTKKVSSSNESIATATATNGANGSYTLAINSVAASQYVTGKKMESDDWKKDTKLSDIGISEGTTFTIRTGKDFDKEETVEVKEDMTLSGFASALSAKGLQATFDENQGRFFISAKDSGLENKFTLTSSTGTALDQLGLMEITQEVADNGSSEDNGVTMRVAADSSIELNGATLTSSTNTVSAGGITINLSGTTAPGETVMITVSNDIDSVYDKVKDFVKSYNELVDSMSEAYLAKPAKGYDMLTDDQKKDMTDEQVELWENKIKDSLLRNDGTLNTLMTSMRSALAETVEVDGKTYSLSSFGIVTGNYNEKGKLHIQGDEEDALYADKEELLKKALGDNTSDAAKALSGIMTKLYDTLTDKMKASTISSALTFYNDKAIQNQTRDYESQISRWETRLEDMEERYYKQFSNMEKMLAELQNKQNQLTNMIGM